MYTQCVLLVALILSALAPVAQQQPGAAPMSGVTIVERLRFEVRSVLANETGDVYSAKRATEKPDDLPGLQRSMRRGSSCWWLWLVSGVDVCSWPNA